MLEVYFEEEDQEELECFLDEVMESYPNIMVVFTNEDPN